MVRTPATAIIADSPRPRWIFSSSPSKNAARRPAFAPLDAAGDPSDPTARADELMAQSEMSARVAAAVAELPERQRAALALCFYEGLSNREAAEILSLTPGAVESLLVRARRALRLSLADAADEFLEVAT